MNQNYVRGAANLLSTFANISATSQILK